MGGLRKITDFWSGLAGPARRLIIGAAAIFVVGLFLLMRLSGQTSYVALVSGASSQDASAITKQLSTAGISYRLTDGGATVQVPEAQLAQARLDLASSHLLEGGGGSVGLEIFDTQKLGATDFTQRVNLLRAQQGELERTIQKLDPVETATVNLAIPEERLFTQDAAKVTASVVVGLTPGATLDSDQVAGITRLVAMAVSGLDPKNVTVTDTSGNILEGSDGGGTGAGAANTRMAIENAYSQQQQARLTALVAGILGPGQAVINYSAQLNLDSSTQESETFDPTKVVILDTDKSSEKLRSTGGGSGAAVGASANTPGNTFPTTTSGTGNTNYDKTSTKQTNGVDRTRTSTTTVPGTVASQAVSVQISDKVPAAQVAKIQKAIEAAVKYNAQRDSMSVQSVTFGQNALATQQANAAANAAKSSGGSPLNIMSIVKGVGAAIGALLVLFMARKSLKRRQSELEKALPELLSRGPVSVASLTEGAAAAPRLEGQTKSTLEQQMEDLALRKPDDMAKLVRAWLVQR